jgi:hypothetical protein
MAARIGSHITFLQMRATMQRRGVDNPSPRPSHMLLELQTHISVDNVIERNSVLPLDCVHELLAAIQVSEPPVYPTAVQIRNLTILQFPSHSLTLAWPQPLHLPFQLWG